MGPMKEREANAAAFIARVRGFLEAQSGDWRSRAGALSGFTLSVAVLRDAHRRRSMAIHDDNVQELADRRAEHDRRDDATEAAFRAACDHMAAAPSEGSLEHTLDAALVRRSSV